jgi:hypothetical protein
VRGWQAQRKMQAQAPGRVDALSSHVHPPTKLTTRMGSSKARGTPASRRLHVTLTHQARSPKAKAREKQARTKTQSAIVELHKKIVPDGKLRDMCHASLLARISLAFSSQSVWGQVSSVERRTLPGLTPSTWMRTVRRVIRILQSRLLTSKLQGPSKT